MTFLMAHNKQGACFQPALRNDYRAHSDNEADCAPSPTCFTRGRLLPLATFEAPQLLSEAGTPHRTAHLHQPGREHLRTLRLLRRGGWLRLISRRNHLIRAEIWSRGGLFTVIDTVDAIISTQRDHVLMSHTGASVFCI